jgi:hypothetical protein
MKKPEFVGEPKELKEKEMKKIPIKGAWLLSRSRLWLDRRNRRTERQERQDRETYFNFEKKKTDKTNKQKRDTKRHK